MIMQYTVAQRVKGILVSSGHNDEGRADSDLLPSREEREEARRAYEDLGRTGRLSIRISSGDYFISEPDGDGAVVTYWGSVHREEERLRLYRLAIENCLFLAAEEDDPSRVGRKRLRVVRP